MIFIGLFYVLAVETSIMMLGLKDTQNYNYALIEAIKMIEVPVVERFDVLYLTVGFTGLIGGVSIFFLALVENVCKFLPKVNRKAIVIGLVIVNIAVCMLGQAAKDSESFFETVVPISGLISAFLIPTVLFVIAKVRGFGKKAR